MIGLNFIIERRIIEFLCLLIGCGNDGREPQWYQDDELGHVERKESSLILLNKLLTLDIFFVKDKRTCLSPW